MNQIITARETPNSFSLYWTTPAGREVPNSRITIDFNPVIRASGLERDFVIVHYQARPLFLRKFGVVAGGEYFSVDTIEAITPYRSIRVNETNLIYPPNAVMIHPLSRVEVEGDVARILPLLK
ncbi:hypothetical protein V0288_09230 [Pannus brasiliensis CCIBt3594]|uniref:Uncharacterized protein n=1 Tax=Pannus brasiliensis CCIBt3594 TaxID=1427578 RepID=A0AAW9QK12_9CHRO